MLINITLESSNGTTSFNKQIEPVDQELMHALKLFSIITQSEEKTLRCQCVLRPEKNKEVYLN